MNALEDCVEDIVLRVLLSDPAAGEVPVERRIHATPIRIGIDETRSFAMPPQKGIEDKLRVRLNGAILDRPAVREGWLCYPLRPALLARGSNTVAFRLAGRDTQSAHEMSVEKLEISVRYQKVAPTGASDGVRGRG